MKGRFPFFYVISAIACLWACTSVVSEPEPTPSMQPTPDIEPSPTAQPTPEATPFNPIEWNTLPELPNAQFSGDAVVLGEEIHLVGGRISDSAVSPYHHVFNTLTNEWRSAAPLRQTRWNLALASVGGKIYAIGGDSFLNSVEIYDPAINEWTIGAPMPTARQHIDCGVLDGKIYVIGGLVNWSQFTGVNEVYDPATDSWETLTPMPTTRHNAATVALDGKIYVIGGSGAASDIWKELTAVEAYDPLTDSWESLAALPASRFKPADAIIDGMIIIAGGFESDIASSSVDAFDPLRGEWKHIGALPRKTIFSNVVSIGPRLYLMGGCDGDFRSYKYASYADINF